MIIMNNITNSHKIGIVVMFIAIALVGSIVTLGGNMAFAKKSNHLDQTIAQLQESDQNAQCTSGIDTVSRCNNVGLLFNINGGNEAAAQR